MKKLTVSIGIPAYNAEQNIVRLLKSLTKQQCKTVVIKNIIVISDDSLDATVRKTKTLKNSQIKIVSNKTRQGFAYSVKKLITTCNSDIIVLLNDDIVIKDKLLIEKLCQPFMTHANVGLVGGNVRPLPSKNIIQKTSELGYILFRRTAYALPTIHNRLTCDGKILALSKDFYKSIVFPKNLKEMGNVDSYLYYLCLQKKFLYRFAENGVIFFKFMDTVNDYIKFAIRNKQNVQIMNKKFRKLMVKDQSSKRFFQYMKTDEIVAYLPYLFTLYLLHIFILIKEKKHKSVFFPTWSVVETTKNLKRIYKLLA